MSQIPQPPQPPRIPPVTPPRMPRPPGAPPGAGKLGGLFKRKKKEDDFLDDSAEDAPAPSADGSDASAAAGEATTEAPPEPAPAPVQYETWAWPSIEQQQPKSKAPKIIFVVVILLLLAGGAFAAYKLLHKDKKEATPAKTTTTAPVAKKQAAGGSTAKAEAKFTASVESILAQSVVQRGKLVTALAATQNNCSIPIDKAKADVSAVADGRQALLAKAKGLPAPTAQTKKVKALLARSLSASLAANRHYVAWVGGLAGASPCPGDTSGNKEFQAADAASVQASAAKKDFTKAFNPLASRLGQKTWSADAI